MAAYSYCVCRISYVGKVKNQKLKMQNYSAKFKNNRGFLFVLRMSYCVLQNAENTERKSKIKNQKAK